ncbi:uncharacterized protein [Temnothorax nylanderi]|uniref:uncharacterized protein n=1 Tax=Temnothorax nylanderi TaxID=102681 RepID=UPI003A8A1130
MSESGQAIPSIEKLKGRENYPSWKFAMTALLEHEDLWRCIEGTETDARKLARAKAKLVLCIDPINYSHIQSATTVKEVWEKLQAAFEDTGLTRRVSLLRTLATTQMEKCNSVDEYVNEIITTAHKLNGLGFRVSDEWIGTLLLAGLPDEYRPMIETSSVPITADSIKTKILQDVKNTKTGKGTNHQTAFLSHGKKRGPRCYKCNKLGHISNQCKSKPKKEAPEDVRKTDKADKTKLPSKEKAFITFLNSSKKITDGRWYVDSCASSHVTNQENCLQNKRKCTDTSILVANNSAVNVESIGDVTIPVLTGRGVEEITAKEVMYVPGSAANLLSVSEMVNKGLSVIFTPHKAYIQDKDGDR